ncbi:MAG: VWA domain-containing protein [Coriobacteriia bacterium]|nr:VWA domain-containing protein [Coriobacteriia bacterium]
MKDNSNKIVAAVIVGLVIVLGIILLFATSGGGGGGGVAGGNPASGGTPANTSISPTPSAGDTQADSSQSYQQMDDLLSSRLSTTEFANADASNRVRMAQEALDEAFGAGLIAGKAEYNEDVQMFSFTYADGTLGGIDLSERTEDEDMPFNDLSSSGAQMLADVVSGFSQPTLPASYHEGDATALVLLAFEDSRRPIYNSLEQRWDSIGLNTDVNTDVTVEDLQNIGAYDVVLFSMHGTTYSSQNTPVMCLREECTSEKDSKYQTYLRNESIARVWSGNWFVYNYFVLPKFFENLGSGALKDTVVFSETCDFLGRAKFSAPDKSFPNAFLKVGAAAVCGFYESVSARYSLCISVNMVEDMLEGQSIQVALVGEQTSYGAEDPWFKDDPSNLYDYPAKAFCYGNTSAKLSLQSSADAATPSSVASSTTSSTAFSIMLDASGSMDSASAYGSSSKMAAAKTQAAAFARMLKTQAGTSGSAAEVAVGTFSSSASTAVASTSDYDSAISAIQGLRASGSTNMLAGLKEGIGQLSGKSGTKTMIFLSDGLDTSGNSDSEILAAADEAADQGITVHTIGFGSGSSIDSALLQEIADRTGGTYSHEDPSSATSAAVGVYATMAKAELEAEYTLLTTQQGTVSQGGYSDDVQFTIDEKGDLIAVLYWPGSKLELFLTDPSGVRVTESYAGYQVLSDEIPVQVKIADAAQGVWTMSVYGAETSMASEPYFVATALDKAAAAMAYASGSTGDNGVGLLIIVIIAGVCLVGGVIVVTKRKEGAADK